MSSSLSDADVDRFLAEGFLRLESAFPRACAQACREALWRRLDIDRRDRSTWTRAVIRLGDASDTCFVEAANTDRLYAAFDRLVGVGRWVPRASLGTFPIRFPSEVDPGDAGWHIDGGYYADGRIFANVFSRGRALLLLFLFSDVSARDAPTRIRVGSHLDVPAVLAPAGQAGLPFDAVVPRLQQLDTRPVTTATGLAGDVFLCHPFLVHAASWPHRGDAPRFLAQPPLAPVGECIQLQRADRDYSAVERAVRRALSWE
jgi:hypothetical protein